jgi:hypothetical protein
LYQLIGLFISIGQPEILGKILCEGVEKKRKKECSWDWYF